MTNSTDAGTRPGYSSLTTDEKKLVCNGIGPDWFPVMLTNLLTRVGSFFFKEASWCHHDFGYSIGYTKEHRALYDRLFLEAMLRDTSDANGYRPLAFVMSYFFYYCVRLMGSHSFHYGNRYLTVDELKEKKRGL